MQVSNNGRVELSGFERKSLAVALMIVGAIRRLRNKEDHVDSDLGSLEFRLDDLTNQVEENGGVFDVE
jgi:hypothetical protein